MKSSTKATASIGRGDTPSATEYLPKRKSVTKNLRLEFGVSVLIERAAASAGKTFTSFVLDAATAQAERHLLDKCFLAVDAKAFDTIENLLAREYEPTERLKALFQLKETDPDDSNNNYAEVRLKA